MLAKNSKVYSKCIVLCSTSTCALTNDLRVRFSDIDVDGDTYVISLTGSSDIIQRLVNANIGVEIEEIGTETDDEMSSDEASTNNKHVARNFYSICFYQ